MRVLLLEDDVDLRSAIARHLRRRGAEVFTTATVDDAVATLSRAPAYDAFITDVGLPDGNGLDALSRLNAGAARPPTIVMTGDTRVETAVDAIRLGAVDYLLKPFSMAALDATLARVVAPSGLEAAPADPDATAEWRRRYAPAFHGKAPCLREVFEVIRRVAPTSCSVLISGETGTGKEVVARAIHAASGREQRPFVAVNCAAVPEHLMESELFGHARGSFTGASVARVGRLQAAHGGTVFLDEIGEMPLSLQAKLLRVLQEKEVQPLGENASVPVDVRVIAATHRDLEAMVRAREFREDLLYRLDVIRVELPALRARREDVPVLVEAFVRDAASRLGSGVSGIAPNAMAALCAYDWPGNVRELQNVVERLVLLRSEGIVTLADLPRKVRGELPGSHQTPELSSPVLPEGGLDLREVVERYEGALIQQALERAGGNKNQAAALLRLNRTTLVEKLKKRSNDGRDGGGSTGP